MKHNCKGKKRKIRHRGCRLWLLHVVFWAKFYGSNRRPEHMKSYSIDRGVLPSNVLSSGVTRLDLMGNTCNELKSVAKLWVAVK